MQVIRTSAVLHESAQVGSILQDILKVGSIEMVPSLLGLMSQVPTRFWGSILFFFPQICDLIM